MNEIAQKRILEGKGHLIWGQWYDSVSLKATGRTKGGNAVVIFAHIENYFSDYRNIRKARKERKMINGAGILPQKEFDRLLDCEDSKTVFVLDHSVLKFASYGWTNVSAIREHPMLKPFLAVSDEEVDLYLSKYKSIFGERIGIWNSDDLADMPLGRLLFLGSYDDLGLGGDINLDYSGRFVGVRERSEL